MRPTLNLLVCVLGLHVLIPTQTQAATDSGPSAIAATESPAQREARIAWWREARFGLFIHWGLYAIPARGEWVQWSEQIPVEEYAKLADEFRPSQFNPDDWAATAKAAGMKYVVLTSRHHDGFALFDDPQSDFTSVKTAAHRDFVADYVKAVRAAGLRVGLYYSPLDWRFPGYIMPDVQRASAEAMRAQYHRQMHELLSNYGKLDLLWFDGGETDWLSFGGDWKGPGWQKRPSDQHYRGGFSWQHEKVHEELRRLQPDIVINGRADMPEDFHSREGAGALGGYDSEHPWELCLTLVEGPWGWQPDCKIRSLETCVQFLVGAAGRDGNLLLNVGPRPDGRIDPPQAQRLREIGEWLKLNGESVYGTRGGPYLPGTYGVSTRRANIVYLHVLHWPTGKLVLPNLPARVLAASVLGGGEAKFNQDGGRLELEMAPAQRREIDTIVKLQLDRAAGPLPVIEVPTAN
ncbi:glycoside hydrolase family 29 [Opitutaceae bacterium EW11]|nr:glycoside hydrolase family 29 [Opitutaceae bacterium EW11]